MQEVGAKCRGTVSALVETEWVESAATLAGDSPEPVGGWGGGGRNWSIQSTQPYLEERCNPRLGTCPCVTCDRASDHPKDGQVLGLPWWSSA